MSFHSASEVISNKCRSEHYLLPTPCLESSVLLACSYHYGQRQALWGNSVTPRSPHIFSLGGGEHNRRSRQQLLGMSTRGQIYGKSAPEKVPLPRCSDSSSFSYQETDGKGVGSAGLKWTKGLEPMVHIIVAFSKRKVDAFVQGFPSQRGGWLCFCALQGKHYFLLMPIPAANRLFPMPAIWGVHQGWGPGCPMPQ